jgi:putative tricarboxylic transport membrane protein
VFRVRSPQDLGAGAVFLLIGAAGAYFGKDLAFGTAARMGPGYFPMLLSWLIIGVGVIVAARGLTVDGPAIEQVQLRPILFVVAAILMFGYLLDTIGLALTAIVLTLVAAYARRDASLVEALLLGAGLALFAVLVFVYALSQPLPAWWGR